MNACMFQFSEICLQVACTARDAFKAGFYYRLRFALQAFFVFGGTMQGCMGESHETCQEHFTEFFLQRTESIFP